MNILLIRYRTKHGEDTLIARTNATGYADAPEVTNDLLLKLGCLDPQVENDSEDDEEEAWVDCVLKAEDLPEILV